MDRAASKWRCHSSYLYYITGASSMSIDQGTWGGMTFNIVDETGSPVSLVNASAQTSNSNIVLAQIEGDKVAVRGINEGDAKVTISYGGTSVF